MTRRLSSFPGTDRPINLSTHLRRFPVSGRPINKRQIQVYKAARVNGKTQKTAAAMAGISERSGRRIEKGEYQRSHSRERSWRTHPDAFADVWSLEVVPLLREDPQVSAGMLFKHLQQEHPGRFADGQLRTFQRRVSQWKTTFSDTVG